MRRATNSSAVTIFFQGCIAFGYSPESSWCLSAVRMGLFAAKVRVTIYAGGKEAPRSGAPPRFPRHPASLPVPRPSTFP